MREPKSKYLNARMRPTTLEIAKHRAEQANMSLAQWLEYVILKEDTEIKKAEEYAASEAAAAAQRKPF